MKGYKEEDAGKATPKTPKSLASPGFSPANRSPKKESGSKKDVASINDPEILIEYAKVHEDVDIQVALNGESCVLLIFSVFKCRDYLCTRRRIHSS